RDRVAWAPTTGSLGTSHAASSPSSVMKKMVVRPSRTITISYPAGCRSHSLLPARTRARRSRLLFATTSRREDVDHGDARHHPFDRRRRGHVSAAGAHEKGPA